MLEYSHKHYTENREKRLAQSKAYRANPENRQRHFETALKWRLANPEKLRGYGCKWYEANRDTKLKSKRQWREQNPEMVRIYSHNRRARQNDIPGFFIPADIERIFNEQRGRCIVCHAKITLEVKQPDTAHRDHIIAITKKGCTNWPENIQLLCGHCNNSKYNKDPCDWMLSPSTVRKVLSRDRTRAADTLIEDQARVLCFIIMEMQRSHKPDRDRLTRTANGPHASLA
jgi:5-methylcytosine-specific restriction endonuclease McrA